MIKSTQIIHSPILLFDEVVPQPRPRFSRATGRVYMPKQYKKWILDTTIIMRRQGALEPLTGPTEARIVFVVERPKSRTRKNNKNQRIPKDTKPDLDNMVKSIMDALQISCILKNDSCVYRLTTEKWYGKEGEGHQTTIFLSSHTKAAWLADQAAK